MSERNITFSAQETDKKGSGSALPVLAGVVLCLLTLALWRTLELQGQTNLDNLIRTEEDFLASHIEADLRSRLPAIRRLARSLENSRGLLRDEFAGEAEALMGDSPGLQALEMIGRDYIVRWIVPAGGNEQAMNLDLSFEKNRLEAATRALATGKPALTRPVDLVQGGKGLLVFFPVSPGGKPEGCLVAVFRIRDWLDYVFSIRDPREQQNGFLISVSFGPELVYQQPGWDDLAAHDNSFVSRATFLDSILEIRVRPTTDFIRKNVSLLPGLLAVSGFLFSLLAAFIISLYRKSRSDAIRANEARWTLEAEICRRKKIERELQQSLDRMELATRAAEMGLWTWDIGSGRLEWNERMYRLMGMPPGSETTLQTWLDLIHPDDLERTEVLVRKAVRGTADFDARFRIIRPDGSVRTIMSAAKVERDADGKAVFMTGLNRDVTDSILSEEALKKSEERVLLLLNSTGEAIYGIDLDGNCTFANPACARMLGSPTAEALLGKNMHRLIHHSFPDGKPMSPEECRIYQAFRGGRPAHVEDEVLWRLDGSSFPVEYWSYPQIANGEVAGAVVTFIDITERKKTEERIRHMATHDGLTDLPTLQLSRDRLAMALGSSRRNRTLTAVLFLDLDGFKTVNDTWGHDAGDLVLREVARRLRSAVRETDTVARIGGDEFLLIITDLQPSVTGEEKAEIAEIAGKTVRLVAQPYVVGDSEAAIGASVGIALYPGDGESADSLIKQADEAMYEVKKHGKNGFAFAGQADADRDPAAEC